MTCFKLCTTNLVNVEVVIEILNTEIANLIGKCIGKKVQSKWIFSSFSANGSADQLYNNRYDISLQRKVRKDETKVVCVI